MQIYILHSHSFFPFSLFSSGICIIIVVGGGGGVIFFACFVLRTTLPINQRVSNVAIRVQQMKWTVDH